MKKKRNTIFGQKIKGKVRPLPYIRIKDIVTVWAVFSMITDPNNAWRTVLRLEFWSGQMGFDQTRTLVTVNNHQVVGDEDLQKESLFGKKSRTMLWAFHVRVGHIEEDVLEQAQEVIRRTEALNEPHREFDISKIEVTPVYDPKTD